MEKFKFDVNWLERHGGSLVVEADSKEEALALLKSDENRLLELMIDKYAYDSFDYLGEVTVVDAGADKDDSIADLTIKNGSVVNK